MGPDFGAGRLQRLKPVDVVGVIVRYDHATNRLAGHAADRNDHRAAQRRRAEGVDHDDAIARHDEARIRHEALVRGARDAGRTLEEPDVLGDPLWAQDDVVARTHRARGGPDEGNEHGRADSRGGFVGWNRGEHRVRVPIRGRSAYRGATALCLRPFYRQARWPT